MLKLFLHTTGKNSDVFRSIVIILRELLNISIGFSLPYGYHSNPTTPKLQHTSNHDQYETIQQNSRKLLMMDILKSETCWGHKKWTK